MGGEKMLHKYFMDFSCQKRCVFSCSRTFPISRRQIKLLRLIDV